MHKVFQQLYMLPFDKQEILLLIVDLDILMDYEKHWKHLFQL